MLNRRPPVCETATRLQRHPRGGPAQGGCFSPHDATKGSLCVCCCNNKKPCTGTASVHTGKCVSTWQQPCLCTQVLHSCGAAMALVCKERVRVQCASVPTAEMYHQTCCTQTNTHILSTLALVHTPIKKAAPWCWLWWQHQQCKHHSCPVLVPRQTTHISISSAVTVPIAKLKGS